METRIFVLPPVTGKSGLIAAMANYDLKFHISNLDSAVSNATQEQEPINT